MTISMINRSHFRDAPASRPFLESPRWCSRDRHARAASRRLVPSMGARHQPQSWASHPACSPPDPLGRTRGVLPSVTHIKRHKIYKNLIFFLKKFIGFQDLCWSLGRYFALQWINKTSRNANDKTKTKYCILSQKDIYISKIMCPLPDIFTSPRFAWSAFNVGLIFKLKLKRTLKHLYSRCR